jgi:hypothetical protein
VQVGGPPGRVARGAGPETGWCPAGAKDTRHCQQNSAVAVFCAPHRSQALLRSSISNDPAGRAAASWYVGPGRRLLENPARSARDQVVLQGEHGRPRPRGDADLRIDVLNVMLCGAR